LSEKQREWDLHFLAMAELIARKSKDPSLGVGCVIVGPDNEVRTTGYNGFCRNVEHLPERTGRPEKYLWTEHAERNAVYNAARMGAPLKGCVAYLGYTDLERGGNAPCIDCARAFIQSGIVEIVAYETGAPTQEVGRDWAETTVKAAAMLDEAGLKLRYVEHTYGHDKNMEPIL
jgi:dCMP deaminase